MKKRMVVVLILSLFVVTFNVFAFSETIPDNPEGETVEEVSKTQTMENNNGEIYLLFGTVENNNGTVETNCGNVYNNNEVGLIDSNFGVIDENYGLVDANAYPENDDGSGFYGTIQDNYGTVNFNSGIILNNEEPAWVFENDGFIKDNCGAVSVNGIDGIVNNSGAGIVYTNAGTVQNAEIQDDTVVAGDKTVYGVTYVEFDNEGDILSYQNSCVYENDEITVEMRDSSRDFFGHQMVWGTITSDRGNGYNDIYTGGEHIQITAPVAFYYLWVKTLNADIFFDCDGQWQGNSFTIRRNIDTFQNVSFNGAYLEKGSDYTIDAAEEGMSITFTGSFCEKNGDGPHPVAILFKGAIYQLYAHR